MKVVFSDMDGTLLNDEHKVSEYTLEMVSKLRAKGVRFVLASGRPSTTMLPFHKQLRLTEPLICCNGAMVVDGDKVIEFFPLAVDIAEKLMDFGSRMSVYGQFYNYGRLASFEHHRGDSFLEFYRSGYEATSGLEVEFYDNHTVPLDGVSKWMFLGEHERLCELKPIIEAQLGDVVDLAFSHTNFLEVVAKGVNKGRAAQALLKKWDIGADEAYAFGDQANDKELLTLMGHGYVMKNGIDELKEIVENVTPCTNAEDGVAKVLARFV